MNPLTDINARLAFTCKHQIIPEASADTDVLFKYARWLQKNNLINRDKTVDAEIARLYRIAAENGHYKASINLQNGALRGRFSLSSHERLRLSQRLIDAKIAAGYYFIAIYLEHGAAGLAQDPEMALRYYRKAADEGSPQAQAYIGKNWHQPILPRIYPFRCVVVRLNKERGVRPMRWRMLSLLTKIFGGS
ncbi:hypothetical protein [Klebsiella michiganensis]